MPSPKPSDIFFRQRSGNYERELASAQRAGGKRKRNRLEAYRFIEQHNKEFGVRWLPGRLAISSNAYYNYRKHRKADYYAKKKL